MCIQCKTKPVYEFTNKRKVCAKCFVRYFQKKVFYTIRRFEMLKKGDLVGYLKLDDFRSVVLEDVLKVFEEKGFANVVILPMRKVDKIAVNSTIDFEASGIISELIKGNVKNLKEFSPVNKKEIKPLYLFLDAEVLLYAKLRKLKFKKEKLKKDKIMNFVDELEKKHLEVKRAVVNSYLKII